MFGWLEVNGKKHSVEVCIVDTKGSGKMEWYDKGKQIVTYMVGNDQRRSSCERGDFEEMAGQGGPASKEGNWWVKEDNKTKVC